MAGSRSHGISDRLLAALRSLGITLPAGSRPDDAPDWLVAEYEQVNDNIRALADIRFKLLAFVPLLSGAGALLLPALLSTDPRSPQSAVLALGGSSPRSASSSTTNATASCTTT
jgi:hypothetical protein